jgi:hypothetical protein
MKLFIPWGNILQAFFIKLTDLEVVVTDPERCVRCLKLRYALRVDGGARIALVSDPLWSAPKDGRPAVGKYHPIL